MGEVIRARAPAKINLFLHITGRRDDGYHELQTLFQFLDLADELEFRLRHDGRIRRRSKVDGVAEDDDLVVRAARLLQAETGTAMGVDIAVQKNLPMGGGLGGGSSDAATTLLAVNRLWGLDLDLERLAELGLRLGADVPVFVGAQAAFAQGVGERLTPVDLQEPWYLLLMPAAHVSTAEVFGHPKLTRDTPVTTIRGCLGEPMDPSVPALMARTRNDCEPLVKQGYPRVAEALDWLSRLAPARMTGTGACVYACFDSEARVREALGQVAGRWRAYVARGANRAPNGLGG